MSAIIDLNEAWHGHTGLEVETFLKSQIQSLLSSVGGKFGYAELSSDGKRLLFYDTEGGSELGSVTFSGDIYTVTVDCDLGSAFYILGSETAKNITITASTTVGSFGSQETNPFPEAHSYTMSVDSGSGYVVRKSGVIQMGQGETIDIRPFVTNGDNYIRFVVTGLTSGQTKTVVITATLTSLWLTCDHTWQTPWVEGSDYTINNIRFAGSIEKYLHIAIDGTEIDSVKYNSNQSYTTTATTYKISSDLFPEGGSGVHTITLWMTAQGVSTQVVTLNTMCAASGDTTPLICINSVAEKAVNFTSDTLFSYAVYNASYAKIDISALMGSSTTPVEFEPRIVEATAGIKYPFSMNLEIESEDVSGVLTAIATALDASQVSGESHTITMSIDNTYSYLSTPGALFYMNPANRNNGESNYQVIVNEAEPDSNFSPSYNATWSGFAWSTDGWVTDASGNKCLSVPAGCSVSIPTLAPLSSISSYQTGMTIEMMIQSGHPSDYDTPIITLSDPTTRRGITIYPTKVVVLGSNVIEENQQMVNICENRITHLAITFAKNYAGAGTSFNLCSIYINGTSNINFSFGGDTTFGSGSLKIGAPDVDTYIYKMRIYGKALESQAVLNNFLNCIIDGGEFTRSQVFAKNNILDGGVVGYHEVKAAGFNTMIVYIPDDTTALPDVNHQDVLSNCGLRFEYSEHPEWNFTVGNVDLDGQGTTSKRYYRWNLRAKTSSSTTWAYDDSSMTDSVGKKGYFAGTGYPKVDRITAKKNYASSMQGHKMGLTGLYDDMYTELGLKTELPDSNVNVAVYQFPFVGFRYNNMSDSYEYIGLYTAGPDKGSKVTFGYSDSYPDLLSIEGPNHAPLGTRFMHPWVDVTYDPVDETLKYGGEEGWDCDYVNYETSTKGTQEDWDAILGLYESEWKPAYDLVYHCSPYIASLASALASGGYSSIADANADIDNFRAGTTDGISNSYLSFYDSNYDLWFYRTKTGAFENLSTVEGSNAHNVKTYLGLAGTPSTAQIKAARVAKFKNEMSNYWSVNQTLYHYCFCVLLGITDNFAKNSYPFKFNALSATGVGNRWGWREDDLDTAFITDNNGMQTKSYSVEHGDTNAAGAEIFQGGSSALWVLIRDNYQDEICTMMGRIANAATSIASSLGITGSGTSGTLLNLISYYCWEHSSKYFSQTLYEDDRSWSYITPWLANPAQQYNGVYPLTQALGDQYQAERLWVERRIAYVFSKYHVGEFTQDKGGEDTISFTLGAQHTFNLKPAIDLYPVISQGSNDYNATRTEAKVSSSNITIPASSDTTVYIHGGNWLSSLGNLSRLYLASRGGSLAIPFSVTSQRMEDLIIGGESGVTFNATSLAVESPTITKIDARNTSTISNSVSLLKCPRLREAYFAGSGATGLTLPVGSRVTDVSFPENVTSLYLNQLHMLENVIWPSSVSNIESLYIKDTPAADSLGILTNILSDENNNLGYVSIIGDFNATAAQLDSLQTLANGNYGKVVYDGDYSTESGGAYIEGTLTTSETDPIGANLVYDIEQAFPELEVNIPSSQQYIDFEDAEVERICLENWDSDSDGVLMRSEAEAVTSQAFGNTVFRGNTTIETFDELKYFTGMDHMPGSSNAAQGPFSNCTSLKSITLPSSITNVGNNYGYSFNGCTALEEVKNFGNVTSIGYNSFQECTSLKSIDLSGVTRFDRGGTFFNCSSLAIELNMPRLEEFAGSGGDHFRKSGITKIINLGSVVNIPGGVFEECTSLTEAHLPTTVTSMGQYAFAYSNNLETVTGLSSEGVSIAYRAFTGSSATTKGSLKNFPFEKVTSLGTQTFKWQDFTGVELNMPKLTSMGQAEFYSTNISKIVSLGTVTTIPGAAGIETGAFGQCHSLTEAHLPTTVTTIGGCAFYGDTALTTISGLENVTSIGSSAFQNDTALTSVNFPNWVNTSTSNALDAVFSGCSSLVTMNAPSLAIVRNDLCRNCTSLRNVDLSSLTTCTNYLLNNCTSLGSIELPSLTNSGNQIMSGCTSLKTVDIGPNLASLGSYAFQNDTALEYVIIRAVNPPTLTSSNAFSNTNDCPIYVPNGSAASYQSASQWSALASRIYELDENGNIPE